MSRHQTRLPSTPLSQNGQGAFPAAARHCPLWGFRLGQVWILGVQVPHHLPLSPELVLLPANVRTYSIGRVSEFFFYEQQPILKPY